MSKQIQIRRGSATEHEDFTGALGEVTMDTTNKTLRVHDGETVGGIAMAKQSDLDVADYVIETWRAADGSSWYRKYKSGWVEQGGYADIKLSANGYSNFITLPLEMLDTSYYCTAILTTRYGNRTLGAVREQFTINSAVVGGYAAVTENIKCLWYVCGMGQ